MVTTMKYVRTQTSVPVPAVRAWDPSCRNLICRPYLFLEEIQGEKLAAHVSSLEDSLMRNLIRQWARYTMQLANLRSDGVGLLQKDSDGTIVISRLLTPRSINLDDSQFPPRSRGPYRSAADYLFRLSVVKKLGTLQEHRSKTHSQQLRATLIESLMIYLLDRNYINGPYVMHHPNLSVENIHIDPSTGNITGVFDWEWTAILPLQSHIHVPDELNYEFMPPGELEKEPGGLALNGWKLDLSKKFRQTFEEELVTSAEQIKFGYPVDEIVDRSLMFTMFEKALKEVESEKYLPALWYHVYGSTLSYDQVRGGMKTAQWGLEISKKSGILSPPGIIQEVHPRGRRPVSDFCTNHCGVRSKSEVGSIEISNTTRPSVDDKGPHGRNSTDGLTGTSKRSQNRDVNDIVLCCK